MGKEPALTSHDHRVLPISQPKTIVIQILVGVNATTYKPLWCHFHTCLTLRSLSLLEYHPGPLLLLLAVCHDDRRTRVTNNVGPLDALGAN